MDIWNFKKSYFPKSHLMVINTLLKMMEEGTKTVYITGNHDDVLRKFTDLNIGGLTVTDKYLFKIDDKIHWAFHGDVFDHTTTGYAKFIAKLGGKGYDILVVVNRLINSFLIAIGEERISFSKRIKNSVKSAAKWISNFEKTATQIAIQEGYDYVICGHIHQPKIEKIKTKKGEVTYMNSGDWIENFSALEYYDNNWNLFEYDTNRSDLKENPIEYSYQALSSLELAAFIPTNINYSINQ
jgi:UDP-2,3-diacylglucosamine pyrophosphatase LpxH